jgi:phytanoyl-CoA hydroxylase
VTVQTTLDIWAFSFALSLRLAAALFFMIVCQMLSNIPFLWENVRLQKIFGCELDEYMESSGDKAHESYLTEEQISFFHDNGYLIIDGFWTKATVDKLRNAMDNILNGFDFSADSDKAPLGGVFTTDEQTRISDDYFLESGEKIAFFWEEKAKKERGENWRPQLEINKIGHALHDLNPDFQEVSYDWRIKRIAVELGNKAPKVVQSMYIFKQPNIGGAVNPHQDGSFLFTKPQSVIGFWWPLDDCKKENGCLWAVPRSHKEGVDRIFRRRDPPEKGTEYVFRDGDPEKKYSTDGAVPLEVAPGTLVLLHSALVHYSAENTSPLPRHAYSIHCVDNTAEYPSDNWLQRPTVPFRLM